MRKLFNILLLLAPVAVFAARPNADLYPQHNSFQLRAAACTEPTSRIELNINNVRAALLTAGDMWWDLNSAQYEIPAGSGKHSLFAGALWIGGVDELGNLKVAANTYRVNGTDFWPGPVNKDDVTISKDVCDDYDRHFKIDRKEIEDYLAARAAGEAAEIPVSMLNYPAHGNLALGQDYYLAPFHDSDNDGVYSPAAGDYPDYDFSGDGNGSLYGDQTIWWIFNDVGNVHGETGADPIGLEVHAQAFGFQTGDEINNMTFYNYKIINRSSFRLENTYFGMWADADLGNFDDDYVGCDVARGLGYCYNGDNDDEGTMGYGQNPPAIGIDFFQGPKADLVDGIDNDRDGILDEPDEEIIMSKFVYYEKGGGDIGDPFNGSDIYNYLRGYWKDGSRMEYGGNGWSGSGTTTGIECDFMFPGDSDPNYVGTGGTPVPNWDEVTSGNTPGDRRFVQSAGAFTLEPGAVNYVTVGVVWAQADPGGGAQSAIANLVRADDKAQALFDNDFKVLNGPDAPEVTIQEMENSLIFYLENGPSSNNYRENYEEVDPVITATGGPGSDSLYRFQGYQVFQVIDPTVSAAELGDPSKARLAFQSDVEDGVGRLINFINDESIGFEVPTVMVDGADGGISKSFEITKDLFAEGNDRLVNHKPYYYMAIAYGYNEFATYTPGGQGQKTPYKAGRRNVKVYTAVPHDPTVEGNGTNLNAVFGMQPSIKRIAGKGNGGLFSNLNQAAIDSILTSSTHKMEQPTYSYFGGPVGVKVIDPLNLPDGDFRLEFLDTVTSGDLSDAYWMLLFKPADADDYTDTVFADRTIERVGEQIISKWGISVRISQVDEPGTANLENMGYIADSLIFEDPNKAWLKGVSDVDGETYYNWIRAGLEDDGTDFDDYFVGSSNEDASGDFEQILNGWMAPFKYVSRHTYGPLYNNAVPQSTNNLDELFDVDLVITNDKSKWSICPVIELAEDAAVSVGGVDKGDLRSGTTQDMNGNPLPAGMGVFPGYAINVATGERLNIAFGENSFLPGDNGADMLWNPSSRELYTGNNIAFGGMHSIFIFSTDRDIPVYDEGATAYNLLASGSGGNKNKVYRSCGWVFGYPIIDEQIGFMATDVTIKLRVNDAYESTSTLPVFEFTTSDLRAMAGDNKTAKANLDKVNVVPNPYYGFSEYEANQFEQSIKVTNLPEECTIKIFTLDGTLVKTYHKNDDAITSWEWDLRNESNLQIASGLYIIHVDAPGIGEKIIKWFGVMRQADLSTF